MTATNDPRPIGRVGGKVALVTGAASGIGQATAELLAREGAVVLAADLDERGAARTADAITQAGGQAHTCRLDVTSESDWQTAADRVEQTGGRLDIAVNCAGISLVKPAADMTLAEWRQVMAVNLDGVFLGTRTALRFMRRQGRGSIVNVASASGIKAAAGGSAYCASKAAVILFSKATALECAADGHNIRVNAVAPGGVKTPMWHATPFWADLEQSAEWNAPADAPPNKRFATPEEIARVILFLTGDESSYVTAAVLTADGGYTA